MRFVVLASQRTGSSHLVNLLNANPQIWCHGNVFKEGGSLHLFKPDGTFDSDESAELLKLRKNDPQKFLDQVYSTNHGRKYVGFKIFEGQQESIKKDLLLDTDVKKVLLYRSNVLARYSSGQIARVTGQWSLEPGMEKRSTPKIKFNERKFLKFADKYNDFYREAAQILNDGRQHYFWLTYDCINDRVLFANLVSFLGADPSARAEAFRTQLKQNSSDVVSRFSNPEAVEQFLADRGLGHWKMEGDVSLQPLTPLAESAGYQ